MPAPAHPSPRMPEVLLKYGLRVRLRNLERRSELNGKEGIVTAVGPERIGVKIDGHARELSVRPRCLIDVEKEASGEGEGGGEGVPRVTDREAMSVLDKRRIADALLKEEKGDDPGALDRLVNEQVARLTALHLERRRMGLPVRKYERREEFLADVQSLQAAVVGT